MNLQRLVATTSFIALLHCSAFAADLPNRKAPLLAPVPVATWTGFYLGANAGYGFDNTKLGAFGASIRGLGSDGPSVGLTGGYDYQFSPNWVAGIAADVNWDGIDSKLAAFGLSAKAEDRWSWGLRGRIGYLISPSTMAYATAGWQQMRTKESASGFRGISQTFNAPVIGAGIETRLTRNWYLHGEYLYAFYNSKNFGIPGLSVEPRGSLARVGLLYKFGDFGLGATGGYSAAEPILRSSWTGAFLGVQAGYGMANTKLSVPGASLRGLGSNGVFGGVLGGYDYQFAPSWVGGVEGDISISDVNARASAGGFSATAKADWDWALRARVGYLTSPNTLVFAAAGYNQSRLKFDAPGFSLSKNAGGFQFGGGIEALVTSNVSVRAEYLQTIFNSKTVLVPLTAKGSEGKARVSLIYKFGGANAAPVFAKY